MIKPNVLSAGAMIALAASAAFAQTPAAVQQTDSFRQRQQLQSTLPPTGQPEEMAAELYPEENADIGPQSILRLKPRHRWFSATVDAQYYYTDNLFLSDQDTIGTDVLLSALQLAITPPAFALGAGRVAPRLGYQHEWYSYGLASSKEVTIYDFAADTTKTSGLSVFDFNAQTFFADARWEQANWIVDAGFDYRRLMDSSRYEQFYTESVPRWGVRRIIPTGKRSALSLGYEGDYRFTSTDSPPPGLEEDYGDRTDHSLIVAYSFSLCEHAVLQPYYWFQYTWFTAGESRTDYLNTFGLALYCPITPNFGARLFISQDLLETTSRLVPDYHKLDTGAGLTITLRF